MSSNKETLTGYEIEIYYRWNNIDKIHEYSVVTKFRSEVYGNYWVLYLWFRIGQLFHKKLPFELFAYKMEWADQKLIKKYKSTDSADRVPMVIFNHFKKVKNKYGTK